MRKLLIVLVVVTAGLIAALVFISRPEKILSRAASKQPQRITIAQAGDFYLYAPLYVAADRGFFSDRGLDVSIVSTGGDEKTWAAVISGSAEFGVADPTFIAIASQRGRAGKIVATIVNGVPFWGISKNPAVQSITKPSELNGYRVATFPAPSTAYTLQKRMFEMGNLSPNIREGAFGTLLSLLESSQADIALELEPNVSQATAKGYRIVYALADVYGDFTITGLTTTPDFISKHRDTVAAVVGAINQSLTSIYTDRDETIRVLQKRFPEIAPSVARSALDRVLAANIIPKNATVQPDAWHKAIQLRIDSGDLRAGVDEAQFIDNSFALAH